MQKFSIDYNELYNYYILENHSFIETIKHFNTTRDILRRIITEYNLQKRNFSFKIPYDELYTKFITENKSAREISEIYNTTTSFIEKLLSRYNIRKPKELTQAVIERVKTERYNDPHYNNSAKCLETNLKRYGASRYNQTQEFKDLQKQRRMSRTPEDILKASETMKQKFIDKYGVTSPSLIPEVRQKISQSLKNRTPEEKQATRNKTIQTNLEKYGVESTNSLPEIIDKKLQTFAKNFKNGHNTREHYRNLEFLTLEFVSENFIKDNVFYLEDFRAFFNFGYLAAEKAKNELGITVLNKSKRYQMQRNLFNIINVTNKVFNTRRVIPNREIDIYLPDFKLGIEFDGLMWHSFGVSTYECLNNLNLEDPKHLVYKTDLCLDFGVNLLHFYDVDDMNLAVDYINSKVGLNTVIDFRGCEVRPINSETFRNFFVENSLEDSGIHDEFYGVFYENKLYQVVGLGDYAQISTLNGFKINYDIFNFLQCKTKIKFDRRFGYPDEFLRVGFKIVETLSPECFYINIRDYKLKIFDGLRSPEFFNENRIFYNCGYYILENL